MRGADVLLVSFKLKITFIGMVILVLASPSLCGEPDPGCSCVWTNETACLGQPKLALGGGRALGVSEDSSMFIVWDGSIRKRIPIGSRVKVIGLNYIDDSVAVGMFHVDSDVFEVKHCDSRMESCRSEKSDFPKGYRPIGFSSNIVLTEKLNSYSDAGNVYCVYSLETKNIESCGVVGILMTLTDSYIVDSKIIFGCWYQLMGIGVCGISAQTEHGFQFEFSKFNNTLDAYSGAIFARWFFDGQQFAVEKPVFSDTLASTRQLIWKNGLVQLENNTRFVGMLNGVPLLITPKSCKMSLHRVQQASE